MRKRKTSFANDNEWFAKMLRTLIKAIIYYLKRSKRIRERNDIATTVETINCRLFLFLWLSLSERIFFILLFSIHYGKKCLLQWFIHSGILFPSKFRLNGESQLKIFRFLTLPFVKSVTFTFVFQFFPLNDTISYSE